MKIKLVLVGVVWLLPVACWFGASAGDRGFAAGMGGLAALVLSVFVLRQPMLRCGNCGAAKCYFVNYGRTVARWQGNWRRWFVCRSCGVVIDRVTGMPAKVEIDTPVVAPASLAGFALSLSLLGALVVFAAIVIGGITMLILSSGQGSASRSSQMLVWCGVAGGVGVVLFALGRWLARRAKRCRTKRW